MADNEDSTDDSGFSMDSPVAASTALGSGGDNNDEPTYGTREQRLKEISEEDSDGTSDDVDVRSLFDTPTVNLIRWQYRQNGMAATVVDKPVKDAFKHSFELGDEYEKTETWLKENYVETQKSARIKARRDGFALVFWILDDASDASSEPEEVNGVETLRVLTLDDLGGGNGDPRNNRNRASNVASASRAAEQIDEYDEKQLVVTRSGLVVVDDITSPDHEDFVGAMYERNPQLSGDHQYEFIHGDRLQLFVERPHVDGDVNSPTYGHVEGDSVCAPIIHALQGITKAEWALGQTLLRYTAPLYAVEIGSDVTPTDGDWEEHIEKMNGQLDNITNKSNVTLPPDHEIDTHGIDGDIDPEPFLDGLIHNICAGSEITRSVLLGTQAGTVSGSSTDIKNYYNQVERHRGDIHSNKLHEAADMASDWTGQDGVPKSKTDFDINWGPLFKIDEMDRVEAMRTVITAVSSGVSKYLFSHEDAREILQEQWAEIDTDIDISEITEEEMDQLDRINTTKGKQFEQGASSENEVEGNPRAGQNGGGRSESSGVESNTTDPNDPT